MAMGATFQFRATAYVYAHVLAESRLRWFDGRDDTPLAVQPETGAAGDDIRVELRAGAPHPEIQVKHGLGGGDEFADAVRAAAARPDQRRPLRFLVDGSSPQSLLRGIADGLDRLRSGRTDPLPAVLTNLRDELGAAHWLWRELGIVQCDVDRPGAEGTKLAIDKLERVLIHPNRAAEAWSILYDDAGDNATHRLRRDRDALMALLKSHGIEVRPSGPNAVWHDSLDDSRRLNARRYFRATLKHLDELERELVGKAAEPRVLYRLHAQRAEALFHVFEPAAAITSAQRALDHQPDAPEALRILTLASIDLGKIDDAVAYAERAIAKHPGNENAWMAMIDANFAAKRELPAVPEPVSSSRPLQLLQCNVAARAGAWARVLALSDELIRSGGREPELLLFRAQALQNIAENGGPDANEQRRNAVRLATELIEVVNDPANDFTRMALIVRALAHAALGEDDEAGRDTALALERYGSEPEVLRVAAHLRGRRGDRAGALDILRHPAVDRDAALLLMRAHALVATDPEGAQRTLDAALALMPEEKRDADFTLRAALVAIDLKRLPVARELLAASEAASSRGQLLIAKGLLAIAEERFDDAEASFRAAVELKPEVRGDMLSDLAFALARAGAPDRALRILAELGDAVPPESRNDHVRLLFDAGDLPRAEGIIQSALGGASPPSWAFARAAELALRRGDPEGARRNLTSLDERGHLGVDGRIRLVLVLTQLGAMADARKHLDLLRADASLNGVQLMETAELLVMHDEADAAIPVAYRAARTLPNDPDVQRAFSGLTMLGGRNWPVPEEVGPNTYVQLRNEAGGTRTFVILDAEPIDPQRHEISVDDARSRGLLGLRLGDAQVDHPDAGYLAQKWVVLRIAPAAVAVAHEVAERFHERFPKQRFYVRAFQSTEGTVTEFLPFIQGMEENRRQVTNLLTIYRTEVLPLGVMAKWLNVRVVDLVESFGRDPLAGGLYVEWVDEPGQELARTAARAGSLVLTRSALVTAQQAGLLDPLAERYELIAPTALALELREELTEARRAVGEGRGRMVPAPGIGFALREVAAHDPTLIARQESVQQLLAWAETHVRFEPRPTESVGRAGSHTEEVRERIGPSSFDAVDLATHLRVPLYADDLGLRRLLPASASCSSVTLFDVLRERGIIDESRHDDLTLTLVLARYVTVRPRPNVIALAVRRPTLSSDELERVCDLLATPNLSLREAATIAAVVIRSARSGLFQRFTTADVTRLLLRSMLKGFRPAPAAVALRREAETTLHFFPADLEQVKRVCAEVSARAFELPSARA